MSFLKMCLEFDILVPLMLLFPHPLEADKAGNKQTHFWEVASQATFR